MNMTLKRSSDRQKEKLFFYILRCNAPWNHGTLPRYQWLVFLHRLHVSCISKHLQFTNSRVISGTSHLEYSWNEEKCMHMRPHYRFLFDVSFSCTFLCQDGGIIYCEYGSRLEICRSKPLLVQNIKLTISVGHVSVSSGVNPPSMNEKVGFLDSWRHYSDAFRFRDRVLPKSYGVEVCEQAITADSATGVESFPFLHIQCTHHT